MKTYHYKNKVFSSLKSLRKFYFSLNHSVPGNPFRTVQQGNVFEFYWR